jgi:sec-independent protein translocase protein TatA
MARKISLRSRGVLCSQKGYDSSMNADIFGPQGLIIIVVLLVLFGGTQLPKLARNFGEAGREFRRAQMEADADAEAQRQAKAAVVAAPAPIAAPPASPVTAESADKITLSKADLNALLDEREARAAKQSQTPPASAD